jgi:acetyltransferase
MRLFGPNCLGIMMPGVSLNASFPRTCRLRKSGVDLQSAPRLRHGRLGGAARRRHTGIISIGDQLDVDIADARLLRAR